ncbi:hypothetical protein PR048_001543 [Dryococelus australis]|uniref:Uncharacterized protein n=1 Tax=Dryococelus australis TaxID=614101 RepID=A0ABQ9IJ46_9NEOP|nr:hypothetical protein PR048_001543 [Dryococelus australis]
MAKFPTAQSRYPAEKGPNTPRVYHKVTEQATLLRRARLSLRGVNLRSHLQLQSNSSLEIVTAITDSVKATAKCHLTAPVTIVLRRLELDPSHPAVQHPTYTPVGDLCHPSRTLGYRGTNDELLTILEYTGNPREDPQQFIETCNAKFTRTKLLKHMSIHRKYQQQGPEMINLLDQQLNYYKQEHSYIWTLPHTKSYNWKLWIAQKIRG